MAWFDWSELLDADDITSLPLVAMLLEVLDDGANEEFSLRARECRNAAHAILAGT